MATNIPPHNLTEVVTACLALIGNPDLTIPELMEHIPGPDFPTAAIINGSSGIREAYETGRGKIYVRARAHIEEKDSGSKIIITELPYQVNKARLVEKIADLVKDKKITGVRELRDESDKDGMRVVIELRRGEAAEVMLNNLYKFTSMQSVFGINIVALTDNRPRLMNLKDLLEAFISHRREVVTRRTVFELRKARARAHILEGQAVALANIDPVIALIKASASPADAKVALLAEIWESAAVVEMLKGAGAGASRPDNLPSEYGLSDDGYHLSPEQAQAILELRLQKLTGLEKDKILKEYGDLLEAIADLLDILSRPERLMLVIREELEVILERYGDERKTEIVHTQQDLSMQDLITEEDVVVTLSHAGYAKSQPIDTYRSQRRGGRGKSATSVKDEDFIDKLFIASTHDTILCFSSRGKVYWLKVYDLPQASRTARGKPIINLLPLEDGEQINAILPIREYDENKYIFMATENGTVKKTSLTEFARPRTSGKRAIELVEGNKLIGVEITDGEHDIMLFSNAGKVVRFPESHVRVMGRTAKGVRGIRLSDGKKVNSLIIVENSETTILTATENGYGKRTAVEDYPQKSRGGVGVISIQVSERNGAVVGAVAVENEDEIMLISDQGTLIRTPVNQISVFGRNTQGVRLVNLNEGEHLAGLERIVEIADDSEGNGESGSDDSDANVDTSSTVADATSSSENTSDSDNDDVQEEQSPEQDS
jgi:DNA gyrase subunit A